MSVSRMGWVLSTRACRGFCSRGERKRAKAGADYFWKGGKIAREARKKKFAPP